MKTKFLSSTILVFAILTSALVRAENEKRNVSSFSEIALSIPGNLYLKQGNTQSIEINANSSTLEKIETEVRGNKLIIRFENERFFWRNFNPGEITIYVTVPEIEGLSVSGSGDIIAQGHITTNSLGLAVSGSGDIILEDLLSEKLTAAISGSGNVNIEGSGTAKDVSISISGSGGVNASGFEAKNVSVKISGSGNSKVFANDYLNITVAGSGDVYYKGNPNVNSTVSGSGSVKTIN